MKRTFLILFSACSSLLLAQSGEDMPINPDYIKFYRDEKEYHPDSVCDCNTDDKKTITVKIKVTKEMYDYDRLTISWIGEMGKSDFKNKYPPGSFISIEMPYESRCHTTADYYQVIFIKGEKITSYDQVWSETYKTFSQVPVYGEYDFLVRSEPVRVIPEEKYKNETLREEEKSEKKFNRRTKIVFIALGAFAIISIIAAIKDEGI